MTMDLVITIQLCGTLHLPWEWCTAPNCFIPVLSCCLWYYLILSDIGLAWSHKETRRDTAQNWFCSPPSPCQLPSTHFCTNPTWTHFNLSTLLSPPSPTNSTTHLNNMCHLHWPVNKPPCICLCIAGKPQHMEETQTVTGKTWELHAHSTGGQAWILATGVTRLLIAW